MGPTATRKNFMQCLRRAQDVGNGHCGCIIVDKDGRELASACEETSPSEPLRHAVMAAIDGVAKRCAAENAAQSGTKRAREEDDYLCQDCDVFTTHEPCVM